MKKLSAFLALILGLMPLSVSADSSEAGQKLTVAGNNSFLGSVTATNLNPVFLDFTLSGPFKFGSSGSVVSFSYIIPTNTALVAAPVNVTNPTTFAAIQITGFSLECAPYNPAFISVGSNYPYTVETNGIAGGTVTIHEYKPTGAVVVVGTVTLADSPHGGPYRNIADHRLAAPYTPTSGSMFDAQVTSSGVPTQPYQFCTVTPYLQ